MNTDKNKPLTDITHGIVAYTLTDKESPNVTVLHFVGYWAEPSDEEWKRLEEELSTDDEFNLVGRIGNDVFLMEATQEMIEFFKTMEFE